MNFHDLCGGEVNNIEEDAPVCSKCGASGEYEMKGMGGHFEVHFLTPEEAAAINDEYVSFDGEKLL